MAAPFIHVAVGVVSDIEGRVLVTRRPDHAHQGGLWEFPGGKVEPGEPIADALQRELQEELGITVLAARPLIRIHHAYTDKWVLLDVWRVAHYAGCPHGLEGQPMAWLHPHVLDSQAFPAADKPIINALRLPTEYLITGEPAIQPPIFLDRLEQALKRGIKLVQLRAKALAETRLADLYRQAQTLGRQYGVPILLNGSLDLVRKVDADGIHLTAGRLSTLAERPLPADRWVAASCHNQAEVVHACRIGVDFIVVSPVYATASHPHALPLGWEGLRELTEATNLPVYALGGMSPAERELAWHHGAQGIAAIRSLWEPAPTDSV